MAIRSCRRRVWVAAGLLLAAGAAHAAPIPTGWSGCNLGDIRIAADFPEARADGCSRLAADHVAVLIMPEAAGINPSPWYAFRVTADHRRKVALTLVYGEGLHRYWPKLSHDGTAWHRAADGDVEIAAGGKTARITVEAGPTPLWIAAQPLWPSSRYARWLDSWKGRDDVEVTRLGWSVQRRPIGMLRTDPGQLRRGTVVVTGRQHPPEVTGAEALARFVATVLDDSALSRRFRATYRLVVVPELNPDGVALGNWRDNAGEVDINRDWGPFTQPETRLMRELLADIDRDPATRLSLFLDFHSTREDVFYTQRDADPMRPALFYQRWLGSLQARMPGYHVNRKPGYRPGYPTAKTWVYEAYGIPACTFELGDDTPPERIEALATEAARAMMETLLQDRDATVPAPAGSLASGKGSFRFGGWAGPPVRVWYFRPRGVHGDTPVLFVMHGVKRDGERYRDEWLGLAREYGAILVVPEFDAQHFPGAAGYNLGGMADAAGKPIPQEKWAFSAIEPLFEAVREMTGTRVTGYDLYGHSAGAQFVHRYLLFMPATHLRHAVAANAGWYTMPRMDVAFPYGLAGSSLTPADLRRALQRRLTVLLGTSDTDPAYPNLRRTPEALAQGAHRLARGEAFMAAAADAAGSIRSGLGWDLQRVPGVGHDNAAMARAAAALLAADWKAASVID